MEGISIVILLRSVSVNSAHTNARLIVTYSMEEFAATTILEIIKAAISCVRTVISSGLRNLAD